MVYYTDFITLVQGFMDFLLTFFTEQPVGTQTNAIAHNAHPPYTLNAQNAHLCNILNAHIAQIKIILFFTCFVRVGGAYNLKSNQKKNNLHSAKSF